MTSPFAAWFGGGSDNSSPSTGNNMDGDGDFLNFNFDFNFGDNSADKDSPVGFDTFAISSSSRTYNNENNISNEMGQYYGPEHTRSLPSLPPVNDASPQDADAILADAMNQLSMRERERVYEDLHGVADIVDIEKQNPQFVEDCLTQFENEICRLQQQVDQKSAAYEAAKTQSVEYVTNRKFRMQFLRADSYNVQHAAVRLLTYFEAKLELFGKEKLARDITQADLSPDDMSVLESGYVQVLSQRDRAGRPILMVVNWACTDFRERENKVSVVVLLLEVAHLCSLSTQSFLRLSLSLSLFAILFDAFPFITATLNVVHNTSYITR